MNSTALQNEYKSKETGTDSLSSLNVAPSAARETSAFAGETTATLFGRADQTQQAPEETVCEGKKTKKKKAKEETKKVTVTTAPCQDLYIFPLGPTETKGVFLEIKKTEGGWRGGWRVLADTDTKQMSDFTRCGGPGKQTHGSTLQAVCLTQLWSNASHPSSSSSSSSCRVTIFINCSEGRASAQRRYFSHRNWIPHI